MRVLGFGGELRELPFQLFRCFRTPPLTSPYPSPRTNAPRKQLGADLDRRSWVQHYVLSESERSNCNTAVLWFLDLVCYVFAV